MVNLHAYKSDISPEDLREWIENKFQIIDEIQAKFGELKKDIPYLDESNQIENFLMGEDLICVPAVYCVLNSLMKLMNHVFDAITIMDSDKTKDNLQTILFLSTKFSTFFELLYASMLENPNEIFYQHEASDETRQLFKHYEYHVPEDMDEHYEKIKVIEEEHNYMIAVASKGFWDESLLSQVFSTATYAIYYYFNQKECQNQAQFFMFLLKEDALQRMLKLPQTSLMKRQVQKSLTPVTLDKKLDIPINMIDEL